MKEIDFVNDVTGSKLHLNYLRNRQGAELDFAPGFRSFEIPLKAAQCKTLQLVGKFDRARESKLGTKVVSAASWLAEMDFTYLAKA